MKKFITIFLLIFLTGCTSSNEFIQEEQFVNYPKNSFQKPLEIPPLVDLDNNKDNFYELNVMKGRKNFIGKSLANTYGYNGNYLGPTLKISRNNRFKIKIINKLGDDTSVHWHGLLMPFKFDGGPHSPIKPNGIKTIDHLIDQQAATLWYHPHVHGTTSIQTYKGLSGILILEDKISKSLNIPNKYGKDDIPLFVQDRDFASNGDLEYKASAVRSKNGFFGNTILINGVNYPYLKVPKSLVRLRLLNASNTRVYNFSFSDNMPFYQIASDDEFLDKAVKLRKLILSTSERAEILLDLTDKKIGDTIMLKGAGRNILKLIVTQNSKNNYEIPSKITTANKDNKETKVTKTRKFILKSVSGLSKNDLTIDNKLFDHKRIDEVVKKNSTEIWEITNDASNGVNMGFHPFHIHGAHFTILDRNGKRPPKNEQGLKDTVLLYPSEIVRLKVFFTKNTGVYVYHCHMLEHEDAGMMGSMKIVD